MAQSPPADGDPCARSPTTPPATSRPCCTRPPISRRTASRDRWCWSGARASTSSTPPASATSRASPGLWCTGLGYGNAELVETAREQMSRLSFSHLFGGRSHEPAIALAEKLKAMAPCPTSKVFFTNSGSEANDTQVKIAWYANNALRTAEEEKDHLAQARLSRHHGRRREPVGDTGVPRRLRSADGARAAHRLPALLERVPSPARARRNIPAASCATSRR